jgi:hypothetical protein
MNSTARLAHKKNKRLIAARKSQNFSYPFSAQNPWWFEKFLMTKSQHSIGLFSSLTSAVCLETPFDLARQQNKQEAAFIYCRAALRDRDLPIKKYHYKNS